MCPSVEEFLNHQDHHKKMDRPAYWHFSSLFATSGSGLSRASVALNEAIKGEGNVLVLLLMGSSSGLKKEDANRVFSIFFFTTYRDTC